MMCVTDSTASRLLIAAGASIERFRSIFRENVDHDYPVQGFTPRTKRAFEMAEEYAVNACDGRDTVVGTEHLLLAILTDKDGIGLLILRRIDVDIEALNASVERFIFSPFAKEEP